MHNPPTCSRTTRTAEPLPAAAAAPEARPRALFPPPDRGKQLLVHAEPSCTVPRRTGSPCCILSAGTMLHAKDGGLIPLFWSPGKNREKEIA